MTQQKSKNLRWTTQNVTLRSLISADGERKIYANYPIFQRSKVWPSVKKRKLIQTILSGGYIPALVCYPAFEDDDERLFILDGQQRLSTVLEYLDGGFTLGGKSGFYANLSAEALAQLNGYTLTFSVLQESDEARLREVYRSLQNAIPLKASETLYSYLGSSRASDLAAEILEHPFFVEMFTGQKLHKEDYQAALYPIAVELLGGIAHLDTNRLANLAGGQYDDKITDDLGNQILNNLFAIQRLFKGVEVTSRSVLIVMYQAAYFLRSAGYDMECSEEGALLAWFNRSGAGVKLGDSGYHRVDLMNIHKNKFQENFWQAEMIALGSAEGLVAKRDNAKAKIGAYQVWINKRYTCSTCSEYSPLADVPEHAFGLFSCQHND